MEHPSPATTSPVWQWTPRPSDALRRKVAIATAVVIAVIIGSAVIAALSPMRSTIVVAFLLGGIAYFWWRQHQAFRATSVSLGDDGVLHVDDGRRTSQIDLSIVDSAVVRKRTQSGQGLAAVTPKWTIELAGPEQTLVHPIAHAAGLFNLDDEDVERLRANLYDHVERHSGQSVGAAGVSPEQPRAPLSRLERFEWTPPVRPHADRRRRWFRIAYVGAALAIAVIGVVTAWGDWVGVVLSAVTVPGLLLLVCGGLDTALGWNRRFRIVVDDDTLIIERGRGERRIGLRGASVDLGRSSNHVATGSGTTRTTSWILTVTASDGAVLRQQMPGFGTTTVEHDYVALERELRTRT